MFSILVLSDRSLYCRPLTDQQSLIYDWIFTMSSLKSTKVLATLKKINGSLNTPWLRTRLTECRSCRSILFHGGFFSHYHTLYYQGSTSVSRDLCFVVFFNGNDLQDVTESRTLRPKSSVIILHFKPNKMEVWYSTPSLFYAWQCHKKNLFRIFYKVFEITCHHLKV